MSDIQEGGQATGFVPSSTYLVRQKRLDDALNLRRPDRVPVAPLVVHYYFTRFFQTPIPFPDLWERCFRLRR